MSQTYSHVKFVTKENNTESALTTYLSVALIVYLCRVPILSPSCTKVLGLLRPVHILHNAPVVSRAQSTGQRGVLSLYPADGEDAWVRLLVSVRNGPPALCLSSVSVADEGPRHHLIVWTPIL